MGYTIGQRQLLSIVLATLMIMSMGAAGTVGGVAATPGTDSVGHQSLDLASSAIQTENALYRANAGGSFTTSTGNEWSTLDSYKVSGEDETASHGQPGTIDSSVPSGIPDQIWDTERWDPSGGEEMGYEFSVPDGQQVEVRLYFYDGCDCTSAVGDRVFDVSVEGQTVLDDFDVIETYGDQTGAMESFTVMSDGTIDVDFAHVVENPQINAIEILPAEPQPDTLGGPGSVDFSAVVTGNSTTEQVTVTNLGESGDQSIDISDSSITGTDASEFSAGTASQTTLAPGESAEIPVTFTPTSVDQKSATLEVTHSGSNSPLTVDLGGEGVGSVPVGFGSSQLDLSGVSVSSINNPTSLKFGPDGRLYVSQQDGTLYAFEVQRNGANDYEVTSAETITTIKNDVPNHNDDGDYNSQEIRQVTGITVAGTASEPVLYVSSSDWRIATGNTNPPSDSLDTNSGVISKLTQTSSGWDHTMLVRGLPRSEENHAPNGLALDAENGVLYLAEGGHTNMGTPSNFFSNIPEYAYSGAILSFDLSEIESMSEKNAANTDVPYLYDLPTLAPGQTSTHGPFGGLDGDNMAVLEQDSPVQVYAPGFRNPYDVHLTEDGELYSVDNGPNGGLGGPPVQCTNEPQNSGTTYSDNLHRISEEGYYAGHPNPVRANDSVYPGAVYAGYDGSVECDYLVPGQEDGALATFSASTNGLTEYTASNFGGAMQGDLLTSSFDGNVYWMERNAQGDDLTEEPTPLLSSGGTLDVTAQGDAGPFPGTVWSAERTDNAIQVFEPNDYDSDGTQCDPSDPDGDADGDGYTNGDEQAVGTDPCSAGSVPADYDDDGNPDQLDNDDDNDGLSDSTDPFALDPDNGLSTELPVELDFSSTDTFANTIPATSGGTDGLGFTGLMTNGQDNYSELYNPDNVFAGGQANLLSVSEVPDGDAYQNNNDQQYAFQFGADTADVTEPFTVHTTVAGFPEDPASAQSAGMFVGTGDQDNYLKFVVSATDGTGGVQLATETDGSFTSVAQPNDATVTGSETATDLYLTVDSTTDPSPNNGVDEYAVTATYTVDGGQEQTVGTTAAPAAWFTDSDQGLAVGVISTSLNAPTFSATWDQLSVQYADGSVVADAGTDQVVDEGVTVDLDASGSTGDSLNYSWTEISNSGVQLSGAETATPTFTAPDVDAETTLTFEVAVSDGSTTDTDTVNVTVQDTADGELVYTVNAGGSEYNVSDGTTYAADPTDALVGTSQTFSTSNWADSPPEIANTDEDPLYRTERYGTDFGYEIPVSANGTYEVTLQFAEIYQGAAPSDTDTDADQTGQRVFDVTTEGQTVLDDYDIYAETGDSLTAIDETYTVEVTDGTLDIGFDATGDDAADNAKISAIQVVATDTGGDNTPPTIDAIADQSVVSGENVNVSVSASDDDGDSVSLSLSQSPEFVTLADGEISIDPQSGDAADSPYTAEVVADDGTTTTTESFQVTVEQPADYGVATRTATDVVINTSTLTDASATLNGTLTLGEKSEATTYVKVWVQGQPEDAFWYTGEPTTQSGEFEFPVVLSPSTTYEWQTLAQSSDGTWKVGDTDTFTTPTGQFFGTDTGAATDVGVESAVLNGEIANLGDNDDAQVYFTYWEQGQKESTLSWYTGPVQSSPGTFSATVGVDPDTTYEYRAFGQSNEGEWKAGPIESFTTQDGQPYGVETDGATAVGDESATLAGNLTGLGDYDAATVYFQYWVQGQRGSTLNWWTGTAQTSPGPFDATVAGLAANTTYEFQAFAQSKEGKWTAGSTQTLTTADADANQPPTADAGTDQTVDEGATVQLDGSTSTDIDGDTLSYSWNQTAGTTVSLDDSTAVAPTFAAPEVDIDETLTFELTVSDGEGDNTDTVDVTVQPTEAAVSELLITPDSTNIEASTYATGSFQLTNTGEQNISEVTIDLSSSAIPDMVFDPDGTAGDQAAKGLSIDSESGDGVGVVSSADGDVFSQPHNGVNGSDGYDVLAIEFTDFEPGETVTFSADNDPTSIKGATISSQEAGPVSGLELARATVDVEYETTTQTTQTIGDGSVGGVEAVADGSVPAAPTIGVQDTTLDSSALDGYHSAATVTNASQTVTVSGSAGANVTILQIEGELELDNVPDYDGSPGYDIQEFEVNKAENVEYYDSTIGSDGTVEIPVTLTDSTDVGGDNYFTAAVTDGDGPGMGSNVVVLDYDESTDSTAEVLHRVNAGESSTLSATDDGPDWTSVAGTSSEYLVSVGDTDSGNYCGGAEITPTDSVSSTTPDAVFDCERYGNATWEFPVTSAQDVEVRLYVGNQFEGASSIGDRQFNVSIEGEQVLTNYDPVADVGHANGTMKAFTATEDGDGIVTVSVDQGLADNPQINAIEILTAAGS